MLHVLIVVRILRMLDHPSRKCPVSLSIWEDCFRGSTHSALFRGDWELWLAKNLAVKDDYAGFDAPFHPQMTIFRFVKDSMQALGRSDSAEGICRDCLEAGV
ncbi:hypothetical protein ACOSQ3_027199 [Xanthoceras sorbifolium]